MNVEAEIEEINKEIVALMLKRARIQRHGSWTQEEAINKEIDALEVKIKETRCGLI